MGFTSTPLSGYPAHRNQFLRTSPDGLASVYWCRSFQRLYQHQHFSPESLRSVCIVGAVTLRSSWHLR